MGVTLGRLHMGMPENLLHLVERTTRIHQGRSEAVTQIIHPHPCQTGILARRIPGDEHRHMAERLEQSESRPIAINIFLPLAHALRF